jgi:hypothetical protein
VHPGGDPLALPVGTPPAVRDELEQENAERHDSLARAGRPDRTIIRAGYRRRTDFEASTTDPDAALMRRKGAGCASSGAGCCWHLPVRQVTGDTTYGTVENIVAVEDQGIWAYVPLPDFDDRTPYYGLSKFVYEPERDAYRCPRGRTLRRRKTKHTAGVVLYRADAAICSGFPVKAACTVSDHGRQVNRSLYAAYLDRVRGYHRTAAYERAMNNRPVWVEPLFGEAKEWHGLGRFRLRRLWKVNVEALLIATGQNLKRLLRKQGWGRRPWPGGAPATPPMAAVLPSRAPLPSQI